VSRLEPYIVSYTGEEVSESKTIQRKVNGLMKKCFGATDPALVTSDRVVLLFLGETLIGSGLLLAEDYGDDMKAVWMNSLCIDQSRLVREWKDYLKRNGKKSPFSLLWDAMIRKAAGLRRSRGFSSYRDSPIGLYVVCKDERGRKPEDTDRLIEIYSAKGMVALPKPSRLGDLTYVTMYKAKR